MIRAARQSGFTLLEVLVASVLMGSVFVAVMSVMTQSLRTIDRMRPHELAMLHAREKMNETLLRDPLRPEATVGDWPDGYRWQLDVAPLDFEAMGKTLAPARPVDPAATDSNARPGSKTLFRVRVTVAWGDAHNPRTYSLETMQWATWEMPKQR